MALAQQVGPYTVGQLLGRGAAGAVFRGRSPDGREVALKVLVRSRPDGLARFDRERRLLAELGEGQGFVPLLDAGSSSQGPYLVMPLVPGGTLRDRLDAGPMPIEAALELAKKLAGALALAHARGIVHRDLKPENVLFDALGRPLVADLGLAKHFRAEVPAAESEHLSKTGELRGTFAYMAPEQARDAKSVGPPADVFSLGAILYECLAGRPALVGQTALEIIDTADRGNVVPLRTLRPDAPRWLAGVVARSLAARAERRFPDAAALLSALEAGPPRRRVALLVAAALALAAAAGIAVRLEARWRADRWTARADALWNNGDATDLVPVIEAATRALEADPERVHAFQRRGEAYLRKGDHARAIADLLRVLLLDPKNDETWNTLGVAYASGAGDVAGAIVALTKCLDLNPRFRNAWVSRARCRLKTKDVDGAIADVSRAIELDRTSVDAWSVRAEAHAQRSDHVKAIADLTRAIELAPRDPVLRYRRAISRMELGQLEEAHEDARTGTELGPKLEVAWFNRTVIEIRRGLAQDAIASATRILELAPRLEHAHALRAKARMMAADVAGALEDANAEIEIAPKSPAGWNLRSNALAARGHLAPALEAADRAVELNPGDVVELASRAELRAELRDFAGAIEDVERALALKPDATETANLEKRLRIFRRARDRSR